MYNTDVYCYCYCSIHTTIQTVRPTNTNLTYVSPSLSQDRSKKKRLASLGVRSGPISALSIRTIQCFLLEIPPPGNYYIYMNM